MSLKIENLKKGDRIWKMYPTQEESEFIVYKKWQQDDGTQVAQIDWADDDYFKIVDDEALTEERYYFK